MQKTHDKVEYSLHLDAQKMAKSKIFAHACKGSWQWFMDGEAISVIDYFYDLEQLTLRYTSNEQSLQYPIQVTTTDCHYGGVRYWFLCPQCNKRALKLYLKHSMFGCRSCQRLNYATQQNNKLDSTRLSLMRVCNRLGWRHENIHIPMYKKIKPKGMHDSTFKRLELRFNQLYHKQNLLCMQSFKAFTKRYGIDYE